MSWLEDRVIHYQYKRPDGEIVILKQKASEERPDIIVGDDGTEAVYCGFVDEPSKQTNVVTYDQNGRQAVRVRNKHGEISHISKTKLHYMRTGRIENQYTPEYQEHLLKTKQDNLLRSQQEKGKGNASFANDLLKNMPDGEYVSDGTNVMPAPHDQKEG